MADQIEIENCTVMLVSQAALRLSMDVIAEAAEKCEIPVKKAQLQVMENALWQITNHYGTDAIASTELMKLYFPQKFGEKNES